MKKINLGNFIFLLILVFWRIFTPGIHVAHDLHQLSPDELNVQFRLPSTWSDDRTIGLGEYSVPVLWSWPTTFIFGLFSLFHFPFNFLIQYLGVLPFIILSSIGIAKVLEYYDLGEAKFVGIFFYLTNSYILLMLDGGQIDLVLAYSVVPIAFYLYKLYTDTPGLKTAIQFILGAAALSFFDIRILYLLALIILIDFLLGNKTKQHLFEHILDLAKLGLISVSSLFMLHLYWLLPAIFALPPNLPINYNRADQLTNLSFATVGHGIIALSPHWYKNIFGQISPLLPQFFLVPLFIFLIPFLKIKNRRVLFWFGLALVGIFLAKGVNEPFGSWYNWLFVNVPGFSLFRDPTKFFFLIVFSYSILISFSTVHVFKTKKFTLMVNWIVIGCLFLLTLPLVTGKMTGMFSDQEMLKDYNFLSQNLENDDNFGRVVWIPTVSPLGFSNKNHPSLEAVRLAQLRPFGIGSVGTYETLNYLREATYSGELFNVAGVSYLTYPPLDAKRKNISQDDLRYYPIFLNQLSNLPWVEGKVGNSSIPLLKTKQHQDHIFMVPNLFWVIGSDNIYNQFVNGSFSGLNNNALIFAEEYPGLINKINEFPEAKIILNQKSLIDLAANLIDRSQLVFPASQLNFQPGTTGWWKRETADFIYWKDFLKTHYGIINQDFDLGGGWAVSEGQNKLTIYLPKSPPQNPILLARVLESTRSGKINFSQPGKIINSLQTAKAGDNFVWLEVGNISADRPLIIESSGDINVVNALALISNNDWQIYKNQARKLADRVVSFDDSTFSNYHPTLNFKQLDETHYQVKVSNLKGPQMLILSESYNSLWKLNGQPAIPVYSFLNGFNIKQDGNYLIEFEGQKYIFPGLIISIITLVLLISILIFLNQKNKS